MNREETIFEQALGFDSPAAREAYLREACAGDEPLFQSLQGLLRVHDRAGKFMEHNRPADGAHEFGVPPSGGNQLRPAEAETTSLVTEKPGDRIGHYKLLEKIGEGGCGVVYMAEQEEPVRRRVALKVIKLGMDTEAVIARFEAERQALALMDHPNIAKIFDAGITGIPLTPSLSPTGGEGVRRTGEGDSGSANTQPSTLNSQLSPGRPYFVMELVRGTKITEYCDHNNLTMPARLALFMQVCRAIQHAHQKGIIHRDIKPSNILVTLHDGVPIPKVIDFGIAKATQGRLTDKTVFTAFHQFIGTPAYMSPEQAEMSGLDIDTRSDIYSLGVLLYELLTGRPPFDQKELLAAGLDEMRRTIREKEPLKPSTRLTQELVAADVSPLKSRGGNERDIRADSRRLLQEVRGDLDWIAMKCLEKDRARRYETANGLASDIQRHLANEPVVARPPSAAYRFQKLVRRNKIAVAATSAVAAALIIGLGVSTWMFLREKAEAAKSQQVAKFLKDTLEDVGRVVSLGRDNKIMQDVLDKLAERVAKDLTNQPEVEAELRMTIGNIYRYMGLYQKGEAMFRNALAIKRNLWGNEHPEVAASLNSLAGVLWDQQKLTEAETLGREALAMREKFLGPKHRDVAQSLNTLAIVLVDQGKLAQAEVMLRQALAIRKALPGKDERSEERSALAQSLSNLSNVLARQGKLAEAETMRREALEIYKKYGGNECPEVAFALGNLAITLQMQGKLAEAETMQRDALRMNKKFLNGDHPSVATSLTELANVLYAQGKLAEGETEEREALATYRKLDHPHVADSLTELVIVLSDQGKLAESEIFARECLAIREKKMPDKWQSFFARCLLGDILRVQKKYAEAEPLLLSGYEGMKRREGQDPAGTKLRLKEALQHLVQLYEATGRSDQAAECKQKLAEFDQAEAGKKADGP
ncbi:MAG: serine/threonine protein kinase [Verrucomicrobia bacterium]|nr:serine/threonine protein kinase [Verrucomicrobiota bacterium]